jgi:hypothetical protein
MMAECGLVFGVCRSFCGFFFDVFFGFFAIGFPPAVQRLHGLALPSGGAAQTFDARYPCLVPLAFRVVRRLDLPRHFS